MANHRAAVPEPTGWRAQLARLRAAAPHFEAVANRTAVLLGVYAALVLVSGSLAAILEGWAWGDGLWWAVTTTTTTGYGDLSPSTIPGRVVAGLTMLAGIVAIGITVGRIAAVVIHTRDDWTHEEQEESRAREVRTLELLEQLTVAPRQAPRSTEFLAPPPLSEVEKDAGWQSCQWPLPLPVEGEHIELRRLDWPASRSSIAGVVVKRVASMARVRRDDEGTELDLDPTPAWAWWMWRRQPGRGHWLTESQRRMGWTPCNEGLPVVRAAILIRSRLWNPHDAAVRGVVIEPGGPLADMPSGAGVSVRREDGGLLWLGGPNMAWRHNASARDPLDVSEMNLPQEGQAIEVQAYNYGQVPPPFLDAEHIRVTGVRTPNRPDARADVVGLDAERRPRRFLITDLRGIAWRVLAEDVASEAGLPPARRPRPRRTADSPLAATQLASADDLPEPGQEIHVYLSRRDGTDPLVRPIRETVTGVVDSIDVERVAFTLRGSHTGVSDAARWTSTAMRSFWLNSEHDHTWWSPVYATPDDADTPVTPVADSAESGTMRDTITKSSEERA